MKELAARFPKDEALQGIEEPDEMLMHLAETYSLSDRLIRNRRVRVGGFSARKLHVHSVTLPGRRAQGTADRVRRARERRHGARRRVGQPRASPRTVTGCVPGRALEQPRAAGLKISLPDQDAKFSALVKVLKDIWAKEKNAKVLIFTEARDTLERLQARLRLEHLEALGYHGDLPMVIATAGSALPRPDGPKLLICTEVGGEGRDYRCRTPPRALRPALVALDGGAAHRPPGWRR